MSGAALVFGGPSPESEVSVRSAANALRAIEEVEREPLSLIWISKRGRWFLQDAVENPASRIPLRPTEGEGLFVEATGERLPIGLAYLFGHGTGCEDGTLQRFFDGARIPYTGSGAASSALCMSKSAAARRLEGLCASIPSRLASACPAPEDLAALPLPLLVKPEASGSSVGVSVLESLDPRRIEEAWLNARAFSPLVLFQKLIAPSRELECGLLQDGDILVPLEVCELRGSGAFMSYTDKYSSGGAARLLCPAPIDAGLRAAVQEKAVLLAREAGCEGFPRVDFLYETETRTLFFNEINTIPGFTATSHYPLMLERSGISRREFVRRIREAALRR